MKQEINRRCVASVDDRDHCTGSVKFAGEISPSAPSRRAAGIILARLSMMSPEEMAVAIMDARAERFRRPGCRANHGIGRTRSGAVHNLGRRLWAEVRFGQPTDLRVPHEPR